MEAAARIFGRSIERKEEAVALADSRVLTRVPLTRLRVARVRGRRTGAGSPTRRILVDEIEWVASTISRC